MKHSMLSRLQSSTSRFLRLASLLVPLAFAMSRTLHADDPPAGQAAAVPRLNPRSSSGLNWYSQGGVVVDGVAYFTANDYSRRAGVTRTDRFPCVVAFDVKTFEKLREYEFTFTYDSSPFVYQTQDGTWLVIAHEYKNARTVAMNRDTGEIEWVSEANQPGAYFFGYSYYQRDDGGKLLLMACQNGLHAMSGETGKDVW